MPFALVTIGMLFVITGFQDTYKQFFSQVESDFSGSDSFIYWFLSFGAVGALGYNDNLKTFSRTFMALILIAMIFANKGVFANFNQAISQGSTTPVDSPGASLPAESSGNNSSSSSTGGGTNDTIDDLVGLGSAFPF